MSRVLPLAALLITIIPVRADPLLDNPLGQHALQSASHPTLKTRTIDTPLLQHWRDTLIPHIEAITGKQLSSIPEVRLVNAEAMRTMLERELTDQITATSKESGPAWMRLDAAQRSLARPSLMGKYSLHDGSVVLSLDHINQVAKQDRLSAPTREALTRITLAHELHTHYRTNTSVCGHALNPDAAKMNRRPLVPWSKVRRSGLLCAWANDSASIPPRWHASNCCPPPRRSHADLVLMLASPQLSTNAFITEAISSLHITSPQGTTRGSCCCTRHAPRPSWPSLKCGDRMHRHLPTCACADACGTRLR